MSSVRRRALLIFLLCTLCRLSPAQPAPQGLTVHDGVLLKDGKPFRAMGINVVGIADEILAKGEAAAQTFHAIKYLGAKHVPFIRFWASYFDNWKPYREDPARYWHNMDLLVNACEKAGVGLVPDLFWNAWTVPFQFGEFRSAWLDDESQTRKFVRQYTREFVSRYRSRAAIWAWEFANEDNLAWDLPNAIALLPDNRKDNRNIVRSYMGTLAERTFAREVRSLDPTRPISSGAAEPRSSQFHISAIPLKPGATWGDDTPEQSFEAISWTAPAPVDLLSQHHYEQPVNYDPAAIRNWLRVAGERASTLHRPLFLGEFGVLTKGTRTPVDLDDEAFRKALTDVFHAVCDSPVALAAYWAFASDSRPNLGAVGPENPHTGFIMDQIADFNRSCAAKP